VLSAQSTLRSLVQRPAVCVPRECTLVDAVGEMERAAVSSLLVEGDGIVTERDIARALGHGVEPSAAVETIATWHPVVAPSSMTVVDAAATMLNEHVRHLVVDVPGGMAVVSMRDVTAVLLQASSPHLWLESLRIAVVAPAETWLG
jgi:CBS domain-containing protein